MVQKFAILYGYPFTQGDWNRFGLDYWLRARFDVAMFDLSRLFGTDCGVETALASDLVARPATLSEFESGIERYAGAVSYFNLPHGRLGNRIARLVGATGARVLQTDLGLLPVPMPTFGQRLREKTLTLSVSRLLSARLFPITATADIHVVTCLSSARRARAPHKIHSHAMDYDVFLLAAGAPRAVQERYGVFLHSSHCDNVDFIYNNKRAPATADVYYPAINGFLDRLEHSTSCPVIIAGHPREQYETNNFAGRPILKGVTAPLVRDAAFVISMATTATNFAVLWRKPLLFLTTRQLIKCLDGAYITAFASALQSPLINVDSDYDTRKLAASLDVDEQVYQNYQDEYIKYPGSPNVNSWKTVIESLTTVV